MKKTIAVATFLALGAGTVGVSALDNISLKGSDTLFDVTVAILDACPGADPAGPPGPDAGPVGLAYAGTGSGAGETAMVNNLQTVAPMSRFLAGTAPSGGVCGFAPDGSDAEGIAFALDAIKIWTSINNLDSCGTPASTCEGGGATGLSYAKTLAADPAVGLTAPYTFATPIPGGPADGAWRDVLRLIYFGLTHDDGVSPPVSRRNCKEPARRALVRNWSNVFQNGCPPEAVGCCDGTLRHAYRRDEASGTTDTFRNLLFVDGLSGATPPTAVAAPGAPGISPGPMYPMGPTVVRGQAAAAASGGPLTVPAQVARTFPFCNDEIQLHRSCQPATVATDCPFPGAQCINNFCSIECASNNDCWGRGDGGVCTAGLCRYEADGEYSDTVGVQGDLQFVTGETPTAVGNIVDACLPPAPTHPTTLGHDALPKPPVFELYSDQDPLRRACCGTGNLPLVPLGGEPPSAPTEQVCNFCGDLGLVLPISVPPLPAGGTVDDVYPRNNCARGRFVFGGAPRINALGRFAVCPNGDCPRGAVFDPATNTCTGGQGVCLVPADVNNDPRCINGRNNIPVTANPTPLPLPPLANRDGRAYNLQVHLLNGALLNENYFVTARQVIGAFYRINTTRTQLQAPSTCTDGICCREPDATHQIQCLVAANKCAIGFAGAGEPPVIDAVGQPIETAFALGLNGVTPEPNCPPPATLSSVYPLTRRVFLNSATGFEDVTGQELELARCFSGVGTITTPLNTLLGLTGFTPVPGGPCCTDLNETTVCGDPAPNSAACGDNGLVGVPTAVCAPICGNSILEAGETCDPPNGINCSALCQTIVP